MLSDPRYYFDANALIKRYISRVDEQEAGALAVKRLVTRATQPILISPLTQLEFAHHVTKARLGNKISRKQLKSKRQQLRRDIGRHFLMIPAPNTEKWFQKAERLLFLNADGREPASISDKDALHVVLFQTLQPIYPELVFVTSDKALLRFCHFTDIAIPTFNPDADTL